MGKLDVDTSDVHHARKLAMGKLDVDINDGHHARKLAIGHFFLMTTGALATS